MRAFSTSVSSLFGFHGNFMISLLFDYFLMIGVYVLHWLDICSSVNLVSTHVQLCVLGSCKRCLCVMCVRPSFILLIFIMVGFLILL